MTIDNDLERTYRDMLNALAVEQGTDIALASAAATLAYYVPAASHGFLRRNETLLIIPAHEESCPKDDKD